MLAKSSAVFFLRRNETVILLGRLCAVSVFLEERLFHKENVGSKKQEYSQGPR